MSEIPQQTAKESLNPPSDDQPTQPTLESVWAEFRGQLTILMNDAVTQFMNAYDDEQIDGFLPDNPPDFDKWIETRLATFQSADDPSHAIVLDAATTLFFMDFGEYIMELMEPDPPDPGVEVSGDEEDETGVEFDVVTVSNDSEVVAMAAKGGTNGGV